MTRRASRTESQRGEAREGPSLLTITGRSGSTGRRHAASAVGRRRRIH